MLAPHVSRTDEKGADASGAESGVAHVNGNGRELQEHCIDEPRSGVGLVGMNRLVRSSEECSLVEETERTRLIADIARLLRSSPMPESTRVAGLTLIGWLARRRKDEAPHAIGIDEARESERRIRAGRTKAR
ncbi:MAG TPA: hypothetical protein VGY54_04370 [Polyangiaceae bacterium]|jgi:hypothetical protein|nr:hypothetical protein [Polyangiaceae bacterium]